MARGLFYLRDVQTQVAFQRALIVKEYHQLIIGILSCLIVKGIAQTSASF